jgi:hypothetical protein
MGDRFFSQVQFGKESTHGTAVAATKRILGGQVGPLSKDRAPVKIEENIGVRSAGYRKQIDQYLVKESLSIPNGYFQILPMLFGCGLKGGVTAVEQTTSQGDYLWDFTPSMAVSGTNAPDSITLEKGDNVAAFEAEYVMLERIKISGKVAQGAEAAAVSIEADYFGRQWTPTTFTAGIALPTLVGLNAKLTRLYLDSTWAGLGTTELAGLLRAFEVDILTGLHPTFSGSGDKFFTGFAEGIIGAQVTLTLEGKAAADTLYDIWHSDTQATQFMQLALGGPQIGTGDNHALLLNVAGSFDEVVPLAEEDRGNNLHTAVFTSLYDPTSAKEVGVQVITNQNAY